MAKAKKGDNVKVHYTGKTNGEVFDSSINKEPLSFRFGENALIPGFEKAVSEMEIGESKTVNLTPSEGYGEHIPQMVQNIPVTNLPEGVATGLQVQGTGPNGEPVIATVTEINEGIATVDFNHPLAGKELEFEIQLLEVIEEAVEEATSEETVEVEKPKRKRKGVTPPSEED
jgi:FKBP-type peptidyl-prolyl cis-trans isomerase 2